MVSSLRPHSGIKRLITGGPANFGSTDDGGQTYYTKVTAKMRQTPAIVHRNADKVEHDRGTKDVLYLTR